MAKVSEMQRSIAQLPSVQAVWVFPKKPAWSGVIWQVIRFGIVGTLNTLVDVVILNALLWYFPTRDPNFLLLYNSIAYTIGAVNSFGLNKYWTFQHKRCVNGGELTRFAIINIAGICCNDGILWLMAKLLHPSIGNSLLWANSSKLAAVVGTAIISYLGMRLWVFASASQGQGKKPSGASMLAVGAQEHQLRMKTGMGGTKYSLSVVMPAHNEEVAIAGTISAAVEALASWTQDYEVIVVNDGSKDRTRAIVEEITDSNPRVRLINHDVNQGYGAALVSGFEASVKDLVFFMDSDGQFDIRDLERFLPLIEEFDAVLGYRIDRQDTWMRKLNAWGWKMLVRMVFKLRVQDIDCAFKLYRGQFFREHRLETRGAMINTEILYKFRRAGYTYTEVGVQHLPRRGGKATGAKLSVIARAFREMFTYAHKWHQEERKQRV